MRFVQYFLIFCGCYISVAAQDRALGTWQSYYTYNSFQACASGAGKVYAGASGLMEYEPATQNFEVYSKVNGLNDASITKMGYDESTKSLLICYGNSNIDLYQNKKFINLPEIKNSNIIASKKINSIRFYNQDAYLATGLGVVVINLKKQEVRTTYPLIINGIQSEISVIVFRNDSIFAFTNLGVYKADARNPFLQDLQNWNKVSNASYNYAEIFGSKIITATNSDVYEFVELGSPNQICGAVYTIRDLEVFKNKLYVAEFQGNGKLKVIDEQLNVIDSIAGIAALQLSASDNKLWIGDTYSGLVSLDEAKQVQIFTQPGPNTTNIFNLKIIGNRLFTLGGGVDQGYNALDSRAGLSAFENGSWKTISQFMGYPALDSCKDLLSIEQDPKNKHYFVTSYGGGLVELDEQLNFVKVIKSNPPLSENFGIANNYLCSFIQKDALNNLWLSIGNTGKNLAMRNLAGKWHQYSIPQTIDFKVVGDMVFDDAQQVWMVMPRSAGLVVFSNNKTPDIPSDDQYKYLSVGKGRGNLASNGVLCLAKDKDGKIWVGTDNGISIFNCPESALSPSGCDAENKIVQFDQYDPVVLFKEESVRTIAVDAGNRKWVGTDNGVWLISEDAEKIVERFTTANSPLPSNEINCILVDHKTGEVYIATTRGLVSFRGSAIGSSNNEKEELFTYPNPVPANYTGPIAIKGFVDDADVRITDAAGNLVHRTKALGGQAIWDGKVYTGAIPQSGVYFIYATNKDGSLTQQGKFVLLEKQ